MTRYPLVVLALLGVLAACSSTTSTGVPAPTSDAGVDSGSPDGDAPAADSGSDTSAPLDCGDDPTYLGCVQCCETVHTEGAAAYYKAVAGCGCKPAKGCATVCATTICAATAVRGDKACTECLVGIQASCLGELQASCGADKKCVAFVGCFSASGCDKKTK